MKVLYLHQYFTTPRGSSGTRSYEMARRLVERGHQVTMVCGSSALMDAGVTAEPVRGIRRGVVDGIEVIQIAVPYSNHDGLWKRTRAFLRYAWKAISIAWQEPYDVLFATSTPLTAAIPGLAMRILKPRHKFVFEVRDLWPELPKAMGVIRNPLVLTAMSALEKAAYLAMDAGVALSPGIERGMRTRCRKGKTITMVPNGCDLEAFHPAAMAASSSPALPSEFPREGLRCVFTGAHGMANGLDAVLDAAAILRQKGRDDIQLVFVGDGKLKPSLLKRKQSERLDNCHFLDPMPKCELTGVLRQADVGMMVLSNVPAFYYGTSPNKFFDYIATGLPVLNNYPGWLADLIQGHRCGLAVPPDDPQAFANALIQLADDPQQRLEMGRNARQLAEESFDREHLAARWIACIEDVAGEAGHGHPPGSEMKNDQSYRRVA